MHLPTEKFTEFLSALPLGINLNKTEVGGSTFFSLHAPMSYPEFVQLGFRIADAQNAFSIRMRGKEPIYTSDTRSNQQGVRMHYTIADQELCVQVAESALPVNPELLCAWPAADTTPALTVIKELAASHGQQASDIVHIGQIVVQRYKLSNAKVANAQVFAQHLRDMSAKFGVALEFGDCHSNSYRATIGGVIVTYAKEQQRYIVWLNSRGSNRVRFQPNYVKHDIFDDHV